MTPNARKDRYITPPLIAFVGKPSDAVDDQLMERFCKVLAKSHSVRTAYLATVSYGLSSHNSLCLCIGSTAGTDYRLQKILGGLYRKHSFKDESLDILFLRDDQEKRLKKVCEPFYRRSSTE